MSIDTCIANEQNPTNGRLGRPNGGFIEAIIRGAGVKRTTFPARVALNVAALVAISHAALAAAENTLELRHGDRICLVGNALGERMQHANFFETLLHRRFPDHELVVRNLCFPADEPYHRMRSLNFGTPDDHLRHSTASVILYFFGLNESFAGAEGVDGFAADLTRLIDENRAQSYDGAHPPRIVLVSPIAHETNVDLIQPDVAARNEALASYAEAMRTIAAENSVGFVDLFTPTKKLFAESDRPLTINGIHLSDDGYKALAPILDAALFGPGTPDHDPDLRAAIADKNFHWWHRYRAVNGYSIYGKRGEAGFDGTYRNRDVMERERAILDQMTANRDRRIWAIAQGRDAPDEVDDSNTLPFFETKTNVGLPDDPNRKRGKLGSLDYQPPEEAVQEFELADGFQINLFASEVKFPELANPVSINFDNQGRLWVAVMPSYPQWQPKTELDDKLLILTDEDGDGAADRCTTFAGGLHQPTGFELGHGGAFVAQQPDILFLRDTDGDDRADVVQRRLIGFDSADSHHGLAAFEWGPGGALYFQEGTFKQSQLETPYGPVRLSNAGVWRYEPRSERLDVYVSLDFANPWGHAFDRWGQSFLADASPGFNYWAAPISGRVFHPAKHRGGAMTTNPKSDDPDRRTPYPTFIEKRIRPSSGCEFIASRHFPPDVQGNFLLNNVIGDRAVLQHRIDDDGSGFVGTEVEPLVKSADGNFRPVDLLFGPDGALYICDWHNALIGHLQHNLRDPNRDHMHGRIWRITHKDRPLLDPPTIAGAPIDELLALLTVPEYRTRYRTRRELAARNSQDVVARLESWVSALDPSHDDYEHHLLEALWIYQTHHHVQENLLTRLLASDDPRVRAAAARVLWAWRDDVDDALDRFAQLVRDAHPRVRLEAVRSASYFDSPRAVEVALEVLNSGMDPYLEYTLEETMRTLDQTQQ